MKPEELLSHADFVRGLSRSLIGDVHLAADISQQTFMAALEKPPSQEKPVRAWLALVIRHFAWRLRKADARRRERERRSAVTEGVPPTAEIVEREEIRLRVVEEVLGLDEIYRSAVILRYYEGLSSRSAAERLGIRDSTFRTRLRRGLERLRARLDRRQESGKSGWRLALAPVAGIKGPFISPLTGVSAMAIKAKTTLSLAAAVAALGIVSFLFFFLGSSEGDGTNRSPVFAGTAHDDIRPEAPAPRSEPEGSPEFEGDRADARTPLPPVIEDPVPFVCSVIDVDGKPVENASVRIGTATRFSNRSGADDDVGTMWTDSGRCTGRDGVCRLELSRGSIHVTTLLISHPDYFDKKMPLVSAVPVAGGAWTIDPVLLRSAFLVEGRVVDNRMMPVADCRVTPLRRSGDEWATIYRIEAVTDDEGRFRLPIGDRLPVLVRAVKTGAGTGEVVDVLPDRRGRVPHVTIALEPSLPIEGVLFNADGTPAVGKCVYAMSEVLGRRAKQSAWTDGEGRFRIGDLPDGLFDVFVDHCGITKNVGKWKDRNPVIAKRVAPGTKSVLFTLPVASTILLRLVDVEGNPVSGEPEITFMQMIREDPDRTGSMHCGFRWSGRFEEKEPGLLRMGNIREGTFDRMELTLPGYCRCLVEDIVVPPPPGKVEVTAIFRPVRALAGTVTRSDGTVAPGVTLRLEKGRPGEPDHVSFDMAGVRARWNSHFQSVVVTGGDGRYRFDDVRAGHYTLIAVVRGVEVHRSPWIEVTDEDRTVSQDVVLPDLTGSIAGRVTDLRGEPLAQAVVVAWSEDELIRKTRADDEGAYAFRGLPQGRYLVDARVLKCGLSSDLTGKTGRRADSIPGWRDAEIAFNAVVGDGEACRLDLTVEDPWSAVVSGRLVSSMGELPPELYVSLRKVARNGGRPQSVPYSISDLFRDSTSNNDVDRKKDSFRFESRRAGFYRIHVEIDTEARGSGLVKSEVFELPPGGHHEMTMHLALSSFHAVVVDRRTGAPLAGSRVSLTRDDPRDQLWATSDATGRFGWDFAPAGRYRLVVHENEHSPFVRDGIELLENVRADDLRCEMDPGYSLSGRIVREDGESASGRVGRVCPVIHPVGAYRYAGGEVKDDGSFLLKGLPPGEITFRLMRRGNVIHEFKATVPAAGGDELIVTLPANSGKNGTDGTP